VDFYRVEANVPGLGGVGFYFIGQVRLENPPLLARVTDSAFSIALLFALIVRQQQVGFGI